MRDPRYDILFEPVRIGPVTARNRFYQVPHCNGMGYRDPSAMAEMRGIKAEGGWAVVSTEECEIHWTSEVTPYIEARLWDERDLPALARMVEKVKAHGSLAAIELVYNGHSAPNRYTREPPRGPSHLVVEAYDPVQARAMSLKDIADLRRWHRQAALRAKSIGFDIIYVYAGHDLALPMHFLSRRHNHRTDRYGGSLENRARLFRELIEDTKEAVGDRAAVAVRLAVDELLGPEGLTSAGEGREVVEMLAELPDLWDVNVSAWGNDSRTARFAEEGAQEDYVAFVKQLTTKPVVGVGRFTSPDAMVSQVRRGILDFIGAARPSIADPFLPRKIEEGRSEDIRECIGCNVCVSCDFVMAPIRCTQNPTMGEEWRRGWHPERIVGKGSDRGVLIVGGGPAGLECALALGRRGYRVALAEGGSEFGGRVALESRLPGLSTYMRVRDHRLALLGKLANVELYRESRLGVEEVLAFGAEVVVLATGARWRRDGFGRRHRKPIPGLASAKVFTPDDLMAGLLPEGRVLLYDDDHYYMGGVLAELIARAGRQVSLVTPAPDVSHWTHNTLEQGSIQTRLLELGVELVPQRLLADVAAEVVETACVFTGRRQRHVADALVLVTSRAPEEGLEQELRACEGEWSEAGIAQVAAIGDCYAPGTVAAAVYSGHRFARELDGPPAGDDPPFLREIPSLLPASPAGGL